MQRPPRLTVLGSLNMDISVSVSRLPGPGETVLGASAVLGPGGKGANQAVAAARLGGTVRMVGCVGDDEFGGQLTAALTAEGIDLAPVRAVAGCATGLALITVDASGQNMITVAAGANGRAGAQEAAAALAGPADVLVLSAEIPVEVLAAVLSGNGPAGRAAAPGQRPPGLLNLAPVPPGAAAVLAAGVDWLVVNESEAGALLGRGVTGLRDAADAAAGLAAMGARNAVVTAGAQGAVLAGRGGSETVPGFSVRSVDAVGAGDAFVAALAVTLAAGVAPAAALRAACAAGATATTSEGAQAALPSPAAIRAATGEPWPVRPR